MFLPHNVWELSERPMQATAAPRSENDQRPPSLETAPAVRLSDLGWTACLWLLNCTTSRAATLKGNTGLDRRAGRHRRFSKRATVLPRGGLARSQRRPVRRLVANAWVAWVEAMPGGRWPPSRTEPLAPESGSLLLRTGDGSEPRAFRVCRRQC